MVDKVWLVTYSDYDIYEIVDGFDNAEAANDFVSDLKKVGMYKEFSLGVDVVPLKSTPPKLFPYRRMVAYVFPKGPYLDAPALNGGTSVVLDEERHEYREGEFEVRVQKERQEPDQHVDFVSYYITVEGEATGVQKVFEETVREIREELDG